MERSEREQNERNIYKNRMKKQTKTQKNEEKIEMNEGGGWGVKTWRLERVIIFACCSDRSSKATIWFLMLIFFVCALHRGGMFQGFCFKWFQLDSKRTVAKTQRACF